MSTSSKLVPTNPEEVMVFRQVTANIVTCSLPFARFGTLKIGGRSTILKLSSGALAVFSPTPLTTKTRELLASLGNRVKYLIAPNSEHYLFLRQWLDAYPSVTIIGPGLLQQKLQKTLHMSLTVQYTVESRSKIQLDPELTTDVSIDFVGAAANELVVLYKPDRTLLVADLLSNLPAREQYSLAGMKEEAGILTRTYNGMRGLSGQPAVWQKRIIWGLSAPDRKEFDATIRRIAAWDFERIVVCHGEGIESQAKKVWMQIFEGHIGTGK